MRILRREGNRDTLYHRAQQLLREHLGSAQYMLEFHLQPDGHLRLRHALTGHDIGTPRAADTNQAFTVLAYDEEGGTRYVDYVLDDQTRNPILEATLDPDTGLERLTIHEETVIRLCNGLRLSLMGETLREQHGLALAATLHTLNVRHQLRLTVQSFRAPGPDETTSRAVIGQDDLIFTLVVQGEFPLIDLSTHEDQQPFAVFVPTNESPLSWPDINPDVERIIAENFGSH